MISREVRADRWVSGALFFLSDPVFQEQFKGIIVRMGGSVKAILLWIPSRCGCCMERSKDMLSKTKFSRFSPVMKRRSGPGFPHIFPWKLSHARMQPFSRFCPSRMESHDNATGVDGTIDSEVHSSVIPLGKLIANQERDVLHCI